MGPENLKENLGTSEVPFQQVLPKRIAEKMCFRQRGHTEKPGETEAEIKAHVQKARG